MRQAIVFFEHPTVAGVAPSVREEGAAAADVFAEMEPYTVRVDDFDDSRETIYSGGEGE